MNFEYNPILGLQYKSPDFELGKFLIIDTAVLPKDFDINDFTEKWKKEQFKIGISLIDSSITSLEVFPRITHNLLIYKNVIKRKNDQNCNLSKTRKGFL